MRRLMHNRALILLLLVPALLGWTPINLGGGVPAAVSGCSTVIDDDFSSGSVGAPTNEWEEAGTDTHANCPWSIGSGVLRWDVNNPNTCDGDVALALNAISAGGADQWSCMTYVQNSGNITGPGLVLRADTVTESTAWYVVTATISGTIVAFGTEAAPIDFDVACGAQFDAGDELCANLSGTGASTSVDVWIGTPTVSGSTPDDFGAADCTLAGTANNDTGNIIGVRASAGDVGTADFIEFDDFRGGSCVP